MIKEILIVAGIVLVVLGLVYFYNTYVSPEEKPVYQGPVPQGYDEDHFRKTGETIRLNG